MQSSFLSLPATTPPTQKKQGEKRDAPLSSLNVHTILARFCDDKNVPHLLLVGKRGTGKSTAIQTCLLSLYGEACCADEIQLSMYVKYVNCAFEKGIQYIRDHLKQFAKMQVLPCNGVCFKCIVLFNADCLTIDAQSALRRCIEEYSASTRFLFHAESIENIMRPILSRLCVLSFSSTASLYETQLRKQYPEQYRRHEVSEMTAINTIATFATLAPPHFHPFEWTRQRITEGWTAQHWLNGIRREMETQRVLAGAGAGADTGAEKWTEWACVLAECETVLSTARHDALALLFMCTRIRNWLRKWR